MLSWPEPADGAPPAMRWSCVHTILFAFALTAGCGAAPRSSSPPNLSEESSTTNALAPSRVADAPAPSEPATREPPPALLTDAPADPSPAIAVACPTATPGPIADAPADAPRIESPEALAPFYEALTASDIGYAGAVTHVAHWGDSVLGNDGITSAIRRRMQARFGDAGHGFHLMAPPNTSYRHRQVEFDHNVTLGGAGTFLSFFSSPEAGDGPRNVTFHDNYFADTRSLGGYLNGSSDAPSSRNATLRPGRCATASWTSVCSAYRSCTCVPTGALIVVGSTSCSAGRCMYSGKRRVACTCRVRSAI